MRQRTMIGCIRAALLLALTATSIAQAADIKVLSDGGTERSPVPAIILVKGLLKNGDDAKFRQTIGITASAIVYLESPGGVIGPAMNIGLVIKGKGFETAVADGATCTSACALAWLGGNPRRMGLGAHIGFHSTRSAKDDAAETAAGNALVGYYLHQLGLSANAVVFVMKATPQSMTYLTGHDTLSSDIHYSALTRAQAERYRDALTDRHVDPLPFDTRIHAEGSHPITTNTLCDGTVRVAGRSLICSAASGTNTVGVDEILTQAAKRVSSGDVAGAHDMLSKFAAPTDIKSTASIAFALAETFDPNMLATWGIRDVPSDAPLARRLYQQAMEHELLAAKAWERLAALGNY